MISTNEKARSTDQADSFKMKIEIDNKARAGFARSIHHPPKKAVVTEQLCQGLRINRQAPTLTCCEVLHSVKIAFGE